jgi:hypothetical protein
MSVMNPNATRLLLPSGYRQGLRVGRLVKQSDVRLEPERRGSCWQFNSE